MYLQTALGVGWFEDDFSFQHSVKWTIKVTGDGVFIIKSLKCL